MKFKTESAERLENGWDDPRLASNDEVCRVIAKNT